MTSDKPLTEEYMISYVEDSMQWQNQSQGENTSRVANQRPRPKGPKCYSCEGFSHIAVKCLNQEDDKQDQSSGSNNQRNS